MASYWPYLTGLAVALGTFLIYYSRTEQGRRVRDSVVLRVPIFGPLFLKAAMSRFASIFAILQESGVAVMDSLEILSGTIGNAAISGEFRRISELVREGRGISAPLATSKYFPAMVVNMVAVGEESGNLDEMLRDVATHYDDEVAYAVGRLSEALGPFLIVSLAVVVGFFALAIFLPMWDLTKLARKGF
jgi:type IV pilus assembly protein PilC